MSERRLVLATDLDGTFAAGEANIRKQLHDALAGHPDVLLIYVTGRSAESAQQLIQREQLPVPAITIADIGTSVLRGIGPDHVSAIEQEIELRWPGSERVRWRLAEFADLELQPVDAPRRVSYWIARNRALRRPAGDEFDARAPDDPSLASAAAQHAKAVARRAADALTGLQVDVLLSGNVYLDVLPAGVNKGSTLLRVLKKLGASVKDCIVAGDSLNDRALFEIGARGIAVGNCEPALRDIVARQPHVYLARQSGAGGILEGLRYLRALSGPDEPRKG